MKQKATGWNRQNSGIRKSAAAPSRRSVTIVKRRGSEPTCAFLLSERRRPARDVLYDEKVFVWMAIYIYEYQNIYISSRGNWRKRLHLTNSDGWNSAGMIRELIFWLNYFELMKQRERWRERADLREPAETRAHANTHASLHLGTLHPLQADVSSCFMSYRYFIDGREECNLVFHCLMKCVREDFSSSTGSWCTVLHWM